MPHRPGHTLDSISRQVAPRYSTEGNMGPFGIGPQGIGGQAVIQRWLSDMFRTQIAPRLGPTTNQFLNPFNAAPRGFGNDINTLMEQIGNIYLPAGGINVGIGNQQGFGNRMNTPISWPPHQQGFGARMNTAMGQMAGYTAPAHDPIASLPTSIPSSPASVPSGGQAWLGLQDYTAPPPLPNQFNEFINRLGISGRTSPAPQFPPPPIPRVLSNALASQVPLPNERFVVPPGQFPVSQQRYVNTPAEAMESTSFAQTMGQAAQRRQQEEQWENQRVDRAPSARAQYLAGQNRGRGGL